MPCSPGWVGSCPTVGPEAAASPSQPGSSTFTCPPDKTQEQATHGESSAHAEHSRARGGRGRKGEHREGTEQHEGHEGARGYMEVHRGAQGEDTGHKQEHSGAWRHRGKQGSTGDMGGTRGMSLGAQRHARDPGGRITWKSKCFQAGSTDQPSELAQGVGVCKNTRDQPSGQVMPVCERHPERHGALRNSRQQPTEEAML